MDIVLRFGNARWAGLSDRFVGGLVHFLSSLYWLLNMPFTWHGAPLAPALGWISLSAYCALYPAAWVWLCWKFFPGAATMAGWLRWQGRSATIYWPLVGFLSAGWLRRQGWCLAAGAIWTALEYMRGTFLSGFPWNFVAASQYRISPLIQIASITGIYGVTFLVVWTSVALGCVALAMTRRPAMAELIAESGLPLLAVAVAVTFGVERIRSAPPPARKLKVAMVQPGIPQTEIWDESKDMARFDTVIQITRTALESNPRLLLWPESAVPDLTPEIQQAIASLVQAARVWLVFCAGTAEPTPDGATGYYNSALLCNPDGMIEGVYHKRRLVIFGEYIPLVRWLPFLKCLTPVGEQSTPASARCNLILTIPRPGCSVLICFEDMFAQEAREHVGADTDFLVNLTNDGWFGHGAEQWQQAASGIFRAVENGVPILRCTNDGLTCWADAQGRIRQILGAPDNVYGPALWSQKSLCARQDHHPDVLQSARDWFSLVVAAWLRRLAGLSPPGTSISRTLSKNEAAIRPVQVFGGSEATGGTALLIMNPRLV